MKRKENEEKDKLKEKKEEGVREEIEVSGDVFKK